MTCKSFSITLHGTAAASQSPKTSLLSEKCWMYVCNCNGVTRGEVAEAIDAGAQKPKDVLAHHGCEPCCGRCLPEIADAIGEAKLGSLVAAE